MLSGVFWFDSGFIGRAARHINGTAILYADRITNSMQRAIGETNRRRTKQVAFNQLHGITPKGVEKRIKDILDGVYDPEAAKAQAEDHKITAQYEVMSEKQIARQMQKMEKQMYDYAKNLEFEKAGQARDELAKLKQRLFGVGGTNVMAIKAA